MNTYKYEELRAAIPQKTAAKKTPAGSQPPTQPLLSTATQAATLPIPLELLCSLENRGILEHGVREGNRNISLFALTSDALGVETWCKSMGIEYTGTAEDLLRQANSRCIPPVSDDELQKIWESAAKSNPTPCLSEDKLLNCLKAHLGIKQKKGKTNLSAEGLQQQLTKIEDHKTIQQQIAEELYIDTHKYTNGILYKKNTFYYEIADDESEIHRISEYISNNKFTLEEEKDANGNKRLVKKHPYATAEWSEKCLKYAKQRVTCSIDSDENTLFCVNGVLVETIKGEKGNYEISYKLRDYEKNDFCIGKPKVTYDPNADSKFLEQLLSCLDPEPLELLLSILSLAFFGGAAQAKNILGRNIKALLIKGDGANGKDSIKMVIEPILGSSRMASVKTSHFKDYDRGLDKFVLAPLATARLNWASENPHYIDITSLQVLKEIITCNEITIEEKHKPKKRIIPNCINIFSLNQVPRLDTASESIKSRFGIVIFSKTYTDKDSEVNAKKGILKADPRFADEQFLIKNVCSAMLNKILEIRAKVFREEKINSDFCKQVIEDIQCENSHLRDFCRWSNFVEGDGTTPFSEVLEKLDEYYETFGFFEISTLANGKTKKVFEKRQKGDEAVARNTLWKRFSALFPKVKKVEISKNVFGFSGLVFKEQINTNIYINIDEPIPVTEPVSASNIPIPVTEPRPEVAAQTIPIPPFRGVMQPPSGYSRPPKFPKGSKARLNYSGIKREVEIALAIETNNKFSYKVYAYPHDRNVPLDSLGEFPEEAFSPCSDQVS